MTLERRFASDDALEVGVEDLSDQGGILEDHPRELTGSPPEELGYICISSSTLNITGCFLQGGRVRCS